MSAAAKKSDEFGDDAEEMERWAARKPRAPRAKGIAPGAMKRWHSEAEERMRSGDWEGASALHLVALYELMFEKTYEIGKPTLTSVERLRAAGAAGSTLRKHFGDDVAEMATFMHWLWTREKGRETWRRNNGRSGGLLTWRVQFSSLLVDEWRVDAVRRRGAG